MNENEISYHIRGVIFKVYNSLGPGLLESVYQSVMVHEFVKERILVYKEYPVPVFYDNQKLDIGFRIDLLIENKVSIEIKSVENLAEVHHKQVITYLKLSGLRLGILVNFNTDNISKSIFRKVNNL